MTAVAAPVVAAGITKATVSTAAAVASAAVGALSAIQQGRQQKQQSEFQAAVERQRAERERLIAASNEDDFRRQQGQPQNPNDIIRLHLFGRRDIPNGDIDAGLQKLSPCSAHGDHRVAGQQAGHDSGITLARFIVPHLPAPELLPSG